MKLLIIGYGRHGKDEAANYLCHKYKMKAESSSHAAARIFIFETLKSSFGYKTVKECFDDRHNHRDIWYQLICLYNKDNKASLAKEIMRDSDIYVGMRDDREIEECVKQNVFDDIIWVDASKRVSYKEPESSCKVNENHANYVIENNGSLEELYANIDTYMKFKGFCL